MTLVLIARSELRPLGWTDALIRQLLGDPDEKQPYKRGIYHTERFLYEKGRVEAAMESEAFRLAYSRRKARAMAPAVRKEAFSDRYGTWRAAVADAAHGMHSINRYAKHQTCSAANKLEIYALKNAFVQLLYETGYCSACWEHILVLPPKKCRECGGQETDWCDRCGGTGNYLSEKRLRFFCFRFNVGRGYTWHQPDNLVQFPVVTTAEPASGLELSGTSRSGFPGRNSLRRKIW